MVFVFRYVVCLGVFCWLLWGNLSLGAFPRVVAPRVVAKDVYLNLLRQEQVFDWELFV